MEIEVSVSRPRTFYKHEAVPHWNWKQSLWRYYYPSAAWDWLWKSDRLDTRHGQGQLLVYRSLDRKVAKGYGKVCRIGLLGITLFLLTTWFTKLPAISKCGLLRTILASPTAGRGRVAGKNGIRRKSSRRCSAEPVFPLMIFSHGLGGSKTALDSLR